MSPSAPAHCSSASQVIVGGEDYSGTLSWLREPVKKIPKIIDPMKTIKSQSNNLTFLQSHNLSVSQSIQSYNLTVSQSYSLTILKSHNPTISQSHNLTISHFDNLTIGV